MRATNGPGNEMQYFALHAVPTTNGGQDMRLWRSQADRTQLRKVPAGMRK